jgi:alanine racemase
MNSHPFREAVIDLSALTANVESFCARVAPARVMAVVKANGFAHGAVEVARAALASGAQWLGVADTHEALALRAAGLTAPILAWLHAPDTDFTDVICARIDVGISSLDQLDAVASAATATDVCAVVPAGASAAVHIELDTGLSRGGVEPSAWDTVFARAAQYNARGIIRIRGVFSHLANTSTTDDLAAAAAFENGLARLRAAGIDPECVHLAASVAALRIPETYYTMVRVGLGVYGLSPFADTTSAELGLVPVMTLRGRVTAVQQAPHAAGTGGQTTVAFVPLGYADGVPRHLSGFGHVSINGARYRICGPVAMDYCVVEVDDGPVSIGDTAVLFGDPESGVPSAQEWARTAGTIVDEIVTGVGERVTRTYVGGSVSRTVPAGVLHGIPHRSATGVPHPASPDQFGDVLHGTNSGGGI